MLLGVEDELLRGSVCASFRRRSGGADADVLAAAGRVRAGWVGSGVRVVMFGVADERGVEG